MDGSCRTCIAFLFFFSSSSQCGGGWWKLKKKNCPMIEKESNKWILDLLNYSLCLQLTRRVHEWEEGISALVPFPPPSHGQLRRTEKVEGHWPLCDISPNLQIMSSYADWVYVRIVKWWDDNIAECFTIYCIFLIMYGWIQLFKEVHNQEV